MRLLLILIFGISTCTATPLMQADIPLSSYLELSFTAENDSFESDSLVLSKPKFKKLKAILLAVFLGHFGVHRIYLGTTPNVPVVYSLTLGGGLGLLPLLDIVAILSSKDLDKFSNNNRVFMWSNN